MIWKCICDCGKEAEVSEIIKKMRRRDPELNSRGGTICTPTEMKAADDKNYKTSAATVEGIFETNYGEL